MIKTSSYIDGFETNATVVTVASSRTHSFSKNVRPSIRLLTGLGVEGDAHCGATVKHRSRVAQNPNQVNLRQVHLVHGELFEELSRIGFVIKAGEIGENITTCGIRLLDLPEGTRLALGATAVVKITGLRNPCYQLDHFQPGLMAAVLGRTPEGALVRKSGVMAVVIAEGIVCPGDGIRVVLPDPPFKALERV